MSPTLMATMPRARTMPNTVAQLRISADDGALDFVSMLRPWPAAVSLALVICAAVSGAGPGSASRRC